VQSETVASITGRARRLMSAPAKLEALAATEAGSIVEPRPSMTAAPSDDTDLDFGDHVGDDTRPGQGLVDQAAQEVAPARQKERHIGER